MTYQEKEKFLKSYLKSKEHALSYAKEIEDLRETVMPSGYHISDMPKHPNYEDSMAAYAGEFWEIQRRLDRATARQIKVVAVINQIAEIDPLGHRLLIERYIKGNKTSYVCRICHVSQKTEYRHRKKAIERLKI